MVGSSNNKGKYGKARRGGGRHFTSLRELSGKNENDEAGMWRDPQDGSSSEDESSSEEEAEEPQGQPKLDANGETMRDKLGNIILEDAAPAGEVSRQERKALKAASKGKSVSIQEPAKDDDEDEGEADKLERLDNANSRKAVKVKELSVPKEGMSRREREEKEKAEAKARYDKAHAAGKTDQAKADMARLRKIREERDKAAAVKKAEADERTKAQQASLEDSGRRKTQR